jgi:hypothetical protein
VGVVVLMRERLASRGSGKGIADDVHDALVMLAGGVEQLKTRRAKS